MADAVLTGEREPVADTVETIMDAAEHRIRTAGYSGFSFREIAADVGVKSASVHYHFPTKDALAAAVARRYNDRIADRIAQGVAAGEHPVALLRDIFRGSLADGARMCLCGTLAAVSGDLPPPVMQEVHRFFDMGTHSLMAGGLSEPQAMQVLATLEGAILMATTRGDPAIFDQATASLA